MINEGEGVVGGDATMSICELGCGAGIPGLIAARSPRVKRVSNSRSIRVAFDDRTWKLTRFL